MNNVAAAKGRDAGSGVSRRHPFADSSPGWSMDPRPLSSRPGAAHPATLAVTPIG